MHIATPPEPSRSVLSTRVSTASHQELWPSSLPSQSAHADMFVFHTKDGQPIAMVLCRKCCVEAFSEVSWTKLFGTHPETSRWDDSSDACFDGEISYTEQGLGGKKHPSERGPILRLSFPINHLLDSDECGFCKILRDFDTEQRLLTDRCATAGVDLQLFYPNLSSGIFLPFILRVSLIFERAHEQPRVNSLFLTLTFDRCRTFKEIKYNGTLTSPSGDP